ncbi:MAG: hypothetical protein ABL876_14665, partial [Chitinophagaceae bacterium]
DKYYKALQSLIERWGIIGKEEATQGNKYFGNKPLTRKSFVIVMKAALNRLNDMLELVLEDPSHSNADSLTKVFRKKRMKGYHDAAVLKVTAIDQYKDVTDLKEYYTALQELVEKYNLVIGSPGNLFSEDKPITHAELQKIFTGFFGIKDIIKPSTKIASRGDWAIYLDNLLEYLQDDLAKILSGD